MSILTKLFSGGAADLVKGVGGVIDNLHTSKEEKLAAEQKIKELVSDYETKMEANITDRWKADMNSDSWLSKNTRPMTLIFLTLAMTIFIVLDSTILLEIKDGWVSLLEALLITVYVAYFGSRGAEKITKIKKNFC